MANIRPMRDANKLRIVAAAEALAVNTYRVTAHFPRDERFGFTAQLRRAAVSIGSNIVEGCYRQGNTALLPFLHHALGSASEMHFQLGLVGRLGLFDGPELEAVRDETDHVRRMLIRLIVTIRKRG